MCLREGTKMETYSPPQPLLLKPQKKNQINPSFARLENDPNSCLICWKSIMALRSGTT